MKEKKEQKKIAYIYLGLLFIYPFFHGGYFYYEASFFMVLQVLLYVGIIRKERLKVSKTEYIEKKHKIDSKVNRNVLMVVTIFLLFQLCMIMFTSVYISKGMSFVKWIGYVGVLLTLSNGDKLLKRGEIEKEDILKTIGYAGATMAGVLFILALCARAGDFLVVQDILEKNQLGEFYDTMFIQQNRLGGFFQYANGLGIFFLIGAIILLFIERTKDACYKRKGYIYIGLFLLGIGIVATKSRTVCILMLGVIFIYFLYACYCRKKIYFYKGTTFFAGVVVGILTVDAIFAFDGNMERLQNITTQASEFQIRLLYYEDGIRMIKENLWGYGHLGYFYIQRYYQTGAAYTVKFIHCSILQYLLDYGVAGLFFIVAIASIFFRSIWTNRKKNQMLYIMPLLVLILHSFVDFDFQFSYLFLCGLFFLYLMPCKISEKENILYAKVRKKVISKRGKNEKNEIYVYIGCVIGIVMGVYITLVSIFDYMEEDLYAYQLFPAYTEAVADIVKEISVENIEKDKADFYVQLAEELNEQNAYNAYGFAFLRDYYYNKRDFQRAMQYGKKAIKNNTNKIDNFEIYCNIVLDYVNDLKSKEQLEEDNEDLLFLLNMEQALSQMEQEKSNWYTAKNRVDFSMTAILKNIKREAKEVLK